MYKFVLILLVGFFIGLIYSLIMKKFFVNKLIIFLPSIAGFFWIIYTILTFNSHSNEGFYDLAVFLMGMIIFSVMLGNIIGGIVFKNRNRSK